jgi:hypothetical protein
MEFDFHSSYKRGYAKNREVELAYGENRWEVSLFHAVPRETRHTPAMGYRFELGYQSNGQLDTKLRGVLSWTVGQYDRAHLNLDLNFQTGSVGWQTILGYSKPLGFPTRFDTTLIAQLGVTQWSDARHLQANAGVGIRHQIAPRENIDLGLVSHIPISNASTRGVSVRFGYSRKF